MKRKFRVVTNQRTLYVVARNTNGVRTMLGRTGLAPGEKIESTTAIADVPPAHPTSNPEQFRRAKRAALRAEKEAAYAA